MFSAEIDSAIRSYWGVEVSQSYNIAPIQQGASGRGISRVTYANDSLIVIEYDNSRTENAQFVPLALQLTQAGISVPQIISHIDKDGCGYCLVQDLGSQTLLKSLGKIQQLDDSSLESVAIINLYQSAIDTIAKLHQLPEATIDAALLQPSFDYDLYRWEQSYFIEHYGASIGLTRTQQQAWLNQPVLTELAQLLAQQPRILIHRDCQSENIMLHQGQAYLIDFQGMRIGLAEYDWASLIYDPYVANKLSQQTQQALQNYLIEQHQLDPDLFQACILQRLMQATGAYAKLSKQGLTNYQSYIQPTLQQLKTLNESLFNFG